MKYIEDLEHHHIGNALGRLCALADIDRGEVISDIAAFVQKQYALYQVEFLPMAFDAWLAGKYADIFKPKRLNVPFVTAILNQYRRDNWQTLERKQPKQLAAPKPEPTDWAQTIANTATKFKRAYQGINELISPRLMAICWREMEHSDMFSNAEISQMVDWIVEYESRYTKSLVTTMPTTKRADFARTFAQIEETTRNWDDMSDAAKFALYTLNHENTI